MRTLLIATFIMIVLSAGVVFADGKVLSVTSPDEQEMKEPAKPAKPLKTPKKKPAKPAKEGDAKVEPLHGEAKPKAAEAKAAEHPAPAAKIATVKKEKAAHHVLFESKPSNAEVVVDGFYAGSTPLQLPLKEGAHKIRLIYPGYEEWSAKISPYQGMRLSANLVEKKPVTSAQ